MMNNKLKELIDKLSLEHSLAVEEYKYLIDNRDSDAFLYLKERAVAVRKEIYSNSVFIRGLIEISNYCKNDCLYCGIRKSNKACERYRLTPEDILLTADEGYNLGIRTFVLQGGEDAFYTDEVLCDIITKIKSKYPECAITLSLGERTFDSYKTLFDAGADRYLLRHETANEEHYSKLHPDKMSYKNRIDCLYGLKKIGFQVGCGFMVGSPFQTTQDIANDLKFIENFKPDMCGIGPFIPHKETPFRNESAGTPEFTCYLLSVVRHIYPPVLLPATTALGTIGKNGRQEGILSGANVVMPNLSPINVRKKYTLYDNKICTDEEAAEGLNKLRRQMSQIGYEVVMERGDVRKENYYGKL